jgi:hypothetical protein
MRQVFRLLTLVAAVVVPTVPVPAVPLPAEPAVLANAAESGGEWRLESLHLKDGRVFRGLIQAERKREVEFAEIVRPPGKPMFAVIRPIDPKLVASFDRLQGAEHQQLVQRFQEFRNRARIEAGRMESAALREEVRDGMPLRVFTGDWFTLESRVDEPLTRRCIVRAEQIFRAYRQVLPPRNQQPTSLRLRLFGTLDDYRSFVESLGLRGDTPACFVAEQNLIVAGSELDQYARQLAQVRHKNQQVRREYEALKAGFPERVSALIKNLRQKCYGDAEIEQETKLRIAVWQRQYDAAMTALDRLDQQNDAKFADVARLMFVQLYHEAFHAYIENYVYPQREAPLPRWLNEGLAQIFEASQFDADTLRVDAPDRERLTRLQDDLKSDSMLDPIDLLTATENDFLSDHARAHSQRQYLYAWGLAYYLTFQQNILSSPTLDAYVANPEHYAPAANFTRLIGMPLPKFQRLWRQAMLELRAPR